MTPHVDVAVIGAGPAGMAAALEASRHGLSVALLDEQEAPGGQIYRNVEKVSARIATFLGPDYQYGRSLVDAFRASQVEYIGAASVWDIDSELNIRFLRAGSTASLSAAQIIIATGAMERPSPLPGWTLPGVMNAGAAQILMKNSGVVPAGPVVLVGSGPLLLLVSNQLMAAGTPVAGLVETNPRSSWRELARLLPGALGCSRDLVKGLMMIAHLRSAGVPRWKSDGAVRIVGDKERKQLVFEQRGTAVTVDASTVLLHHGVIPNTQLTRLLRLDHEWDERQMAWRPKSGRWGETANPSIRVVGDGAGIGGAKAAEMAGTLAGLGASLQAGRITEIDASQIASPLEIRLARVLGIRPLLDHLYRPPEWLLYPMDDVIVCRCEEVTAGQIREMAHLSCKGPNQTKFFSRCGMGPCQGRMCGSTVTQLLAKANQTSIQEVGYYRIRAPLKPIPLGALASNKPLMIEEKDSCDE